MSLLLSDEQIEFRDIVRKLVIDANTLDSLRASDFNHSQLKDVIWEQLVELGVPGILVPEEFEGLGMTLTDASVILEELGRELAPSPFLSSAVLAVSAILQSTDESLKGDLLPQISTGDLLMTLATRESNDTWLPNSPQTRAELVDGRWEVSGTKKLVLDGDFASSFIVLAEADGLPAFFVVEGKDVGVTKTPLHLLDRSRGAAELLFNRAAARLIPLSNVRATLEHLDAVASAGLVSETYGAYLSGLEKATQYARERFQFGRSIGSFQAIKHSLSEMTLEAELTYSMLRNATRAATESTHQNFLVASLAAEVKAQSIAYAGSANMLNVFGGIGYTWEHHAHLYMKHLKTNQQLLGSPSKRRQGLASALEIQRA